MTVYEFINTFLNNEDILLEGSKGTIRCSTTDNIVNNQYALLHSEVRDCEVKRISSMHVNMSCRNIISMFIDYDKDSFYLIAEE